MTIKCLNFSGKNNICKGKYVIDLYGIAILLLSLTGISATLLFPAIAFVNYDSCYHISEHLFAGVPDRVKLGVRLVVALLTVKEVAETMVLIGSCMIAFVVSTKQILVTINNSPVLQGVEWYKRLQIVTETGRKGLRNVAGVLMAVGYVVITSGNYGVISSTGTLRLPIPVYICQWIVQVGMYIALGILLPLVIDYYSLSKEFKSKTWTNSCIGLLGVSTKRQFRILRKRVRSLMPITYYYGYARFDEETKTSFYIKTILNTIDLLLLKKT